MRSERPPLPEEAHPTAALAPSSSRHRSPAGATSGAITSPPPASWPRGGTPCLHSHAQTRPRSGRHVARGAHGTTKAACAAQRPHPAPKGDCSRPARRSQVRHGRHSRLGKTGDRGSPLDPEAGARRPEAQVIRMAGGMDFRRPFPRVGAEPDVARGRHRGQRHAAAPAGGGAPGMRFAGTALVDSRARRTKWG